MTYAQIVIQEIRLGRNSIRAILESQPRLMAYDVRAVIRRLLYGGVIETDGRGHYTVVST